MHSLLARRGPLLGFVAGATVLLTASAAFACTQTAGKVTITGTNAIGSATYQGNGKDEQDPSTRGYCTPPSRLSLPNAALTPTLEFTLTASAGSCKIPGTTTLAAPLPPGDYEVRWIKATDPVITDGTGPNCHRDSVDPSINDPKVRSWIPLGIMTVNPSAPTTKSFSLATGVSRGPGNICLARQQNSTLNAILPTGNIVAPVIFINWTTVI